MVVERDRYERAQIVFVVDQQNFSHVRQGPSLCRHAGHDKDSRTPV
jgi:hypothetical protein